MNAHEVDISLAFPGLRNEADQEGDEFSILLHDEARVPEVPEEEPGKQPSHVPALPPLVNHGGDFLVVRFANRPHRSAHGSSTPAHGSLIRTQRAVIYHRISAYADEEEPPDSRRLGWRR